MKLIGSLKMKVDNAQTKEEARDAIREAGMVLDDDELEAVSGGGNSIPTNFAMYDSECIYQNKIYDSHEWVAMRGLYICERCHRICKDKKAP